MEKVNQKHLRNRVHHVLAHSYIVYLIWFFIGVALDLVFPIRIFTHAILLPIGFVLLVLASLLILWAQKTGRNLRNVTELKTEHFHRGPYRYTKIPTQYGLLLLMLGFGFVANASFVIVTTIISFFVARFVFMGKHEKMLEEKYGVLYKEYKKLVKF